MDTEMDKYVKKGMELGVGMAYMALDAVNSELKRLEKQGKISRKDSEKAVKEIIKQYQMNGSKYAKKMQAEADAMVKSNKFVTKKDLAELNKRIEKLNNLVKKYTK